MKVSDFIGVEDVSKADESLGGLPQDHFANGRLFASVASHGGLIDLSYWGNQHLGAPHFFSGNATSAWTKLFRISLLVEERRYYPILRDAELFPFGLRSHCRVEDISFRYELLLLEDALVQRMKILENPRGHRLGFEVLHQETVTAVIIPGRNWTNFVFDSRNNALVASCADQRESKKGEEALAQKGFDTSSRDLALATTWIALGSNSPLSARCGYHQRSKHYLRGESAGTDIACHIVFATSEARLQSRLQTLSQGVHQECDRLLEDYKRGFLDRPHIETGSPILDSAFNEYPAIIDRLKVLDRPGAVRATASGYFVWGWDGMMPLLSDPLSNDARHAADVLRFFHQCCDNEIGIPHAFTSTFEPYLKAPFPAQAQFIAGLYRYFSATGDLDLVREVWPTCLFILEKCRKYEVQSSGLVSGSALWPDFPEAMEETGHDISSLNNSLLYQGLRAVEYLAAELDQDSLATETGEWAAQLRKSFHQYLFDEEKGFFISSCSAEDFSPRKHYCAQAVFWLTPFAGELVSHASERIADFMSRHLRSAKCLLTLPHWDTAWMADGNQLGSSFPAADSFYLGVHQLAGEDWSLKAWMGDVEWFWRYHTAPEAFTPEAENEDVLGPDNIGTKQLQALTTWYAGAFHALAGIDFDHEGLTLTPVGGHPLKITGWDIRQRRVDIRLSGEGCFFEELRCNGKAVKGSYKIPWKSLPSGNVVIECGRSRQPPAHPVILRADGLNTAIEDCAPGFLTASISGIMAGKIRLWAPSGSRVYLNGSEIANLHGRNTWQIPVDGKSPVRLEVSQ